MALKCPRCYKIMRMSNKVWKCNSCSYTSGESDKGTGVYDKKGNKLGQDKKWWITGSY